MARTSPYVVLRLSSPHRVFVDISVPRRSHVFHSESFKEWLAVGMADGSGLVFPGTKRGKALSDMTLSMLKGLGFDADVHGFRTSFRTWAQEQTNFPREVAEAALAVQSRHLMGGVGGESFRL